MVVKVKQDSLEKIQLVIFDRDSMLIGSSLALFFLGLDSIFILILTLNWNTILPIIDQTPIIPGIIFLSVLSLFIFFGLTRAFKCIMFNKESGRVCIFNLISKHCIHVDHIDHLEASRKGPRLRAWIIQKGGKKTCLFKKRVGTDEEFEKDPMLIIEKHLRNIMEKYNSSLTNYQTRAEHFKNHRDEGLEHLKLNKNAEAITSFKAAVEQDPSDRWSWRNLGTLQERMKDIEAAIHSYEKVIELHPRDKLAINRLTALSTADNPVFTKIHERSFLFQHWPLIGMIMIITGIFMAMIAGSLLIFNMAYLHRWNEIARELVIVAIVFVAGNILIYQAWTYPHPKLKIEANRFMELYILVISVLGSLACSAIFGAMLPSTMISPDFITFIKSTTIQALPFAIVVVLLPLLVTFAGYNGIYSKTRMKINKRKLMSNFLTLAGTTTAITFLLIIFTNILPVSITSVSILTFSIPFSLYFFLKLTLTTLARTSIIILVESTFLYSLVFAGFFPLIIIFGIGAVGIIIWLEIRLIKRMNWELIPGKDRVKLKEAGIRRISTLINLSEKDLKNLSKNTGISLPTISKWQDIIELSTISGISIQHARILKDIGIDSIKELARRNPDNTFKKFEEYHENSSIQHVEPPTPDEIMKWIQRAEKKIQ